MTEILHITEKTQIDESIEEHEFHSYEPIAGINLNNIQSIFFFSKAVIMFNQRFLSAFDKADDKA